MDAARRLLTITFDDGFADSSRRTAAIFEEFGLKASFNVIAGAGTPGWTAPDEWHNAPYGDWALWNELAARGHEIHPHSWSHRNHATMAPADAVAEVDRCLEAFARNLKGFRAEQAVYVFPYNRGGPEVEAHILARMRAYRVGGEPFNPTPSAALRRLGSVTSNAGICDGEVAYWVNEWLDREPSWLLFSAHGLDPEGWGPMTPGGLKRILERVLRTPGAEVITPSAALAGTA